MSNDSISDVPPLMGPDLGSFIVDENGVPQEETKKDEDEEQKVKRNQCEGREGKQWKER
jgi:hypothetical protein